MKNLFFSLALLLLSSTFFSFQSSNINDQKALQKCLDASLFTEMLEKDSDGNYLPLTIVSNQLFDRDVQLQLNGESVKVIEKNPEETSPILEVKKFTFKGNRVYFRARYDNKKIKIKLIKKEGEWQHRSVKIKSGNEYLIDIEL